MKKILRLFGQSKDTQVSMPGAVGTSDENSDVFGEIAFTPADGESGGAVAGTLSCKRTSGRKNQDKTSSVPLTKASVSVDVMETLKLFLILYNKKNPESKITVREFVDEALQRHMKKLSSEVYTQSFDILSKG